MSNIESYEKLKNKFVELLKIDFSAILKSKELISERINSEKQKLLDEVEAGVFTIAVVGVIKRGKSTLLNAILKDKQEILSTSVTPETAKLSYIRYSDFPYAVIHKKDSATPEGIDLKDLYKYTSAYSKTFLDFRKKNKGVKELVENTTYADIFYPNEYLKKGIELVDTPGVDDPDKQRSQVTEEFIAKADAVVFMIDVVEGGLKNSELEFLRSRIYNKKHAKGVIVVCNKIHALRQSQRSQIDELIRITRDTLFKELNHEVPVLPIDAKLAWEGFVSGDKSKITDSKFESFLNSLEAYLINSKGKIIIKKRILDYSFGILDLIIDELKFKIKVYKESTDDLKVQIQNIEQKINIQKQNYYEIKKRFLREKESLLNKAELSISEVFNLQSITNINDFQSFKAQLTGNIQQVYSEIKSEITFKLNNFACDLNPYEISTPDVNYTVEFPELRSNDYSVTRQNESPLLSRKIIGASSGAIIGNAIAPGVGLVIGGLVGFFLGDLFEENTNLQKPMFDITKFRRALSTIADKMVLKAKTDTDIILNSFFSGIENWLESKEKQLTMQKEYLLSYNASEIIKSGEVINTYEMDIATLERIKKQLLELSEEINAL